MRISSGTLLRLWAFALLIVASNSMFAANWYVKLTGNNANNGSTWANAKSSIHQMVNSPNVSNGDIIFIEGGIYIEQVVIGNKSVTLLGSQDSDPSAPQGRTIIGSPAYSTLTPYTFGTALSWNGAGKLSSNTIRPVVFVNATSSSVSVNIKQIDINGSSANMSEASTDMLVGLAYRYASGTVGGSGADNVTIKFFNGQSTFSDLNNAFGAMILTRSAVTFSHVKIEDYRNAGIAVVGENLSTASSVIANQPNPTIIDCEVKGKTINTVSSGDFIQSGILIANGARATVKRTLVWKNRTDEANYTLDRFAYGIYLNDARTVLIGETTTNKANGNLITDNEIGIYVRINSTAVSATGYTIRQNTIAYNGNKTPSGRIAPYGSETAQNTSYGAIRFNHVPVTNQTLSVTNNAWGNSEAHLFFSANPTTADYVPSAYDVNRVAFWNQDKGDQITYNSPLSPLYGETLFVHEDNSPVNAVPGAASTGHGIGLNLEFGFYNFSQLNRAVYAAREQAGTGNTPNIHVKSSTTEDETAVITKSINIFGDSAACGSQSTIRLANALNMPTVWAYGLNTQSAGPNNNSDALTRTPNGITLKFLNFGTNNLQSNSAATPSTGPAMLVTGASGGSNTPTGVQLYSCAMAPEFDGSPLAISTDQDGALTGRYSAAPVTIDARFTKKSNNCDLLLVDNDVRDNRDNTTLSLVLLDDVVEISSGVCADLQNAINVASLTSPRTTIRILANMGPCIINANTPAKVRIETIAPATLDISVFNLNNGGGQGGNIAVCGMEVNTESSGITTIARVNVWPPACLNDAANIVTDNPNHIVVAANSNAIVGVLPFRESVIDSMNYVILQKRFDMFVATGATAINGVPSPANQTFTGRFIVQDRLRHDGFVLGWADVPVIAGTMHSTNGTTFGSNPVQVEMKHSRLNADLTNYDFHYVIPFYGGSIEMAQQFINPALGSRRMNFTNPTFGEFGAENARIYKRVFADGLANRGTQVGTIRLDGSGNCLASGTDESSVLRNLNTTNVVVVGLTDCIQTALGRVVDCEISNQDIEGVGTNSSDGSGGTVDIAPALVVGNFNQNLEIAKSVILGEAASVSLGNGALTLRRGAVVGGSASFFASNVVMTQCFPAHNPGFPANPRMIDAMNLVGTGAGNTITLTGYGNTNAVAVAGNSPRGVWQFENITVNRHVEIKGTNANVSSNLLTTDCSLLSSSSFPGVNAGRNLSVETVIGGNQTNAYNTASGRIFNITNSGASINGISFRNITGGGAQTAIYINAGLQSVSVLNNILNSDKNSSLGLVINDNSGAALSNIDVKNNHIEISTGFSPFAAPISIANITNTFGQNEIIGNAVNVSNSGIGVVLSLHQVNNSAANGTLVSNNWLRGGTSHGMYMLSAGIGLNGITIENNTIRNGFGNGIEVNVNGIDPGTNGITIRGNILAEQGRGVNLSGDYSAMTTNRIFINGNNLSGSTNGVEITGITDNTDPSTNMFDLRFNYWGSELGPVRGGGVAVDPLFATPDSVRIRGHVPFNHVTGSQIVDNNGTTHGRWSIYPVQINDQDGSLSCGWQLSFMMQPVLRVNGAGDALLGMYSNISNARNDISSIFLPANPRSTSDQLFVVDSSVWNGITYGYVGATDNEPSYPVIFDQSPQPSVIRGLERPRITKGTGTGNIRVASTYPTGFTIKDFISHVATSGSNVTMIEFLNPFSNTADYNFIASSFAHTTFTGIRFFNNTNADANNLQQFTNNRINFGQNPGWPGGPSITSAPTSFIGIQIADRGGFGGNGVIINNNEISTAAAVGTRSIGIDVNATNNNNFGTVSSNIIRHMSAALSDVSARDSKWGTGIYVTLGTNFTINSNDIAGGNEIGNKGHDGITLDRPTSFNVNSNSIATRYASLRQENWASLPMRGYGIKMFSSNGSGDVNGVNMVSNTFGSDIYGSASAAVYTGGTSGTVNTSLNSNQIYGSNAPNTGSTCNCAAVQVATGVYANTPSSGVVSIAGNIFGATTSNHFHNTLDLAIGTNSVGTVRVAHANNLAVDVQGNVFANLAQNAILDRATIVDGRPFAGSNIRNIFGRSNWANISGTTSAGQGASGNNTFSHGTILTGEANLANYSVAMSRTGNAQQLNPALATEPVKIWRRITEPMSAARSTDSINTVEVRENRNISPALAVNAGLVYNESVQFPDQRVLLLGPIGPAAFIRPNTTPVAITSIGRENKDIRGGIALWMNNAGQLYGQIPGSSVLGAVNKGDVYVQGGVIGADPTVAFFYEPTSIFIPRLGLMNSSDLTTDIKAGIDDADDNLLAPGGADTRHRTGVFVRGNGSSFTKQDVPTAVTGSTLINAYPNPANSDVTVSFIVPLNGMVRIALYNALGQKVTDLREEYLNASNYTTSFNVSDLPSGTYHVRMTTEGIDTPLTTSVTVIK
jgi:hypothetical protein